MTLTWATSLDVSEGIMTGWTAAAAVSSLAELLNLGFVGGVLADWSAWDPTLTAGDHWSLSGLYAVLWGMLV
tara:strand:- start:35 stop:250 length:216 start_codon:yes stop_codon:yes gene_type:complete